MVCTFLPFYFFNSCFYGIEQGFFGRVFSFKVCDRFFLHAVFYEKPVDNNRLLLTLSMQTLVCLKSKLKRTVHTIPNTMMTAIL